MIKRILKVLIVLVCFPVLFLVVIVLPLIMVIAVVKYIVKGGEVDFDMIFKPMEWAINLPYYFTDRF